MHDKPKVPTEPYQKFNPANFGRTGYGELKGEKTSMFGQDLEKVEQLPENLTPLELKGWHNYSLKTEYPPLIANPETNRSIWQEMEIETMLDYHPTHEIHPNDLPNYHFWPSIQNELDHPLKAEYLKNELYYTEYHQDATAIPRFNKPGIPKTPLQEQDWYIPLTEEGRFDWKENIKRNGNPAGLFSKQGWEKRYFVQLNKCGLIPMHVKGVNQFAQPAIFYRHQELPIHVRQARQFYGTRYAKILVFFFSYIGGLMYVSGNGATWRTINWVSEPWNYDQTYGLVFRDGGSFHGVL